ncbi:MAG: TldD/PmbA family protein [Deltaproteobacteria bacterium]|nr:TldD/PmbA family protein [Deltaproteobacteria bacterium]
MSPLFKNEKEKLETAANKLLSYAINSGADTAEVCGGYGTKTKITLEKQDYHLASSDDGYSLGVRVLKGNRQGFASCNSTDATELKEIAIKANEIAGFSPDNPHYNIQRANNIPIEAPHNLVDPALTEISLQTQKEWTQLLVAEATKDKRFRLNEGGVEIGTGISLVINSLGTHQMEVDTAASWSLMGMGVQDKLITSFDYFSHLSRHASTTPERIILSTRKFIEEVLRNLNTGRSESYKGLVIFSPRAVLDILISSLSYHFNGRVVAETTGRWGLKNRDQQILNSQLSLKDNPWLRDRSGCSTFDREGTPTRPMDLIEKGVLKSFCLDHYAAHALKLTSTGHAAGGPSSLPAVSTHTLCLAPGEESQHSLYQRVSAAQKSFLVVQRYSGQSDPVTGDFSGVAKGAEWWVNGERRYYVQETLISGNIFQSLGEDLFAISKETEIIDCDEESPTLVINNISVTGG